MATTQAQPALAGNHSNKPAQGPAGTAALASQPDFGPCAMDFDAEFAFLEGPEESQTEVPLSQVAKPGAALLPVPQEGQAGSAIIDFDFDAHADADFCSHYMEESGRHGIAAATQQDRQMKQGHCATAPLRHCATAPPRHRTATTTTPPHHRAVAPPRHRASRIAHRASRIAHCASRISHCA